MTEVIEEVPPLIPQEDKPLDAVIIIKTVSDDGIITATAFPNGNVDPLQVQTLIELGLKAWRQKLALG